MKKNSDFIGRRKAIQILGAGSAAGAMGWMSYENTRVEAKGISASLPANVAAKKGRAVAVHKNWYYFAGESGNPLVFTGSHTWGRKREKKIWVSDGWDLEKFNKYLDFLHHWNHNYIRLWMWEQDGTIDIWQKNKDGKYDLSKLNQAFFDRTRSFVDAAASRGIYAGVMLFQGWSGCCPASMPDWPRHAMHKDNNVNSIDGDPERKGYGARVHSLEDAKIVAFQEMYVTKMIDTLNRYDNILWEIGNETIESSIPWKAHMVRFIHDSEKNKPEQHLVLDGTGNGVGNNSVYVTQSDTFSPCVVTQWASPDDPFIANPPIPDGKLGKPIILDNDHLGNHFLRFSALSQRNWTWKAFTRGNHPIHMDCYDVFWDGEEPTPDHPVPGVATNPHYDPQRKSLGDVQLFAKKMDLAMIKPVSDPMLCSSTFCLANDGKEYLAYQPEINKDLILQLPPGDYTTETFDSINSQTESSVLHWSGENKTFPKPGYVREDWLLYLKRS